MVVGVGRGDRNAEDTFRSWTKMSSRELQEKEPGTTTLSRRSRKIEVGSPLRVVETTSMSINDLINK